MGRVGLLLIRGERERAQPAGPMTVTPGFLSYVKQSEVAGSPSSMII